jgi:hypothetical protein
MLKFVRWLIGLPGRAINAMAEAMATDTVVHGRRIRYTRVIQPMRGDIMGIGPVGPQFVAQDLGPAGKEDDQS